jgi:hypothetical protein
MIKRFFLLIFVTLPCVGLNASDRVALPRDIQIGQDIVYNKELYQIVGFEKQTKDDFAELTLQLEKPHTFIGIEFARTYLTLIIKDWVDSQSGLKTEAVIANKSRSLALKSYALISIVAYKLLQQLIERADTPTKIKI